MSVTRRPGALDRRQDLRQRRNVAAREDVFADPGIGDAGAFGAADRMQQHDAVVGERGAAFAEELVIEADPDMLEHADRDDAVERAGHVAVVLQPEFDARRQSLLRRARARRRQLLLRQRDAGDAGRRNSPRDRARARPSRSRCRARAGRSASGAWRPDGGAWRAGHRRAIDRVSRNRRSCIGGRHRERANTAGRRDRNDARHCAARAAAG